MENRKSLIGIAVALVAVIALAAVGYNLLAAQNAGGVPSLQGATSGQSSASDSGQSSASDSGQSSATSSALADGKDDATSASATTGTGEAADGQDASSSTDAAASTGSTSSASGNAESSTSELVKFDDFAFEDLDGNKVQLSGFYGKPTLLGFWATWCPPCNSEAPHMQKLYETYGDRVNFVMIDVASDGRDTPEVAREWADAGGYTYPIYADTTGDASLECQVHYLPTMYVLDAEGNILTGFSGALDEESGTNLIEQLLGT